MPLIRSILVSLALLPLAAGCTRTRYRLAADRQSYNILGEKTAGLPWQLPSSYSVQPDPRSRFYDPTPPDDPLLPIPSPKLYDYQLPELPTRDRDRFRVGGESLPAEEISHEPADASRDNRRDHTTDDTRDELPPPPSSAQQDGGATVVRAAHWLVQDEGNGVSSEESGEKAMPPPAAAGEGRSADYAPASQAGPAGIELRVPPLPPTIWEDLPAQCLSRMFEFESVRDEFQRTYSEPPDERLLDSSPRVALEDIIELALLNSREYQTQKELLYRAALRLTLERYDYVLKFSPTGNGTSVDYVHNRVDGITTNTLAIPTTASLEKVLGTGGTLVSRFANDVVLTFNGPNGFAADVGSELFFSLSQSVLQRDIVFEQLTQSERDVVYAARNFARFRKLFFRDLATRYYNLLLSFRSIEIDSQDYFSNSRAFHQGEAEYRAGRLPRVQVDQLEQNSLRSRSQLIGSCTALEGDLDNLKFAMGLPPEMPINLNLDELEELTLRDRASVSGERVRRAYRNLTTERRMQSPDRGVLLNGAIDLAQRIQDLVQLRSELGHSDEGLSGELRQLLIDLSFDEARQLVAFNREAYRQAREEVPPAPPLRIFQRTNELVQSLARLADLQLANYLPADIDPMDRENLQRQLAALRVSYEELQSDLEEAVSERQLDRVTELVRASQTLLQDAETFAAELDRVTQVIDRSPEESLQVTFQQTDRLLAISQQLLRQEGTALPPLEMDMDEAALAALVERFDLMNEREQLADTWRRIKLTGDDLRSVLNLNATQIIRTDSDVNRPFDFTFDDSQTRLSLQLDTPLNRRAQRNAFRSALIDYQAGLRNLMAFEDDITLSVRDDLRQLALNREQYRISIASAALAYERVISTRLQLQLGVQNVAARDFLEAQQAYTASLSSVAGVQIRYVLNRIQLFLDLEQLEVDDSGFWPDLYDRTVQPQLRGELPNYARPAYGQLPPRVWYSRRMRRMLWVPTGTAEIQSVPQQQ